MNYTITISHGEGKGSQILQLTREFSYKDGYNGTCKRETVTDGLEDGKGYNVTIFVDGGYMVGNSSSTILTFSKLVLVKSWLLFYTINMFSCCWYETTYQANR